MASLAIRSFACRKAGGHRSAFAPPHAALRIEPRPKRLRPRRRMAAGSRVEARDRGAGAGHRLGEQHRIVDRNARPSGQWQAFEFTEARRWVGSCVLAADGRRGLIAVTVGFTEVRRWSFYPL